jgi:hypothetical protein
MANYNVFKQLEVAKPTSFSDNFKELGMGTGMYAYVPMSYSVNDDKKIVASQQPSTQVPTGLSSSQTDIRLEQLMGGNIIYPVLQWTLLNNTLANITYADASSFINHIEIYGQNGGNLLFQQYSLEYYLQNAWLDRNTYEAQAFTQGLTTAYANSPTTILPGGSFTFNLPLYQFFMSTKIVLEGLNSNLLVRIYWNPLSYYVIGGAIEATTTNLQLVITGKKLKKYSLDKTLQLYKSPKCPLYQNFLSIQRQSNTIQMTPGATFSITLTGLSGVCAALFFVIRAAADVTSAANSHNYVDIQNFDVVDVNNMSLIGFYRRDDSTAGIQFANTWNNNFRNDTNTNMICWAADPRGAFATSENSGFAILTSFEKLSITMLSSLAPAAYQVDILAYCYDQLIVNDGHVKSTRS